MLQIHPDIVEVAQERGTKDDRGSDPKQGDWDRFHFEGVNQTSHCIREWIRPIRIQENESSQSEFKRMTPANHNSRERIRPITVQDNESGQSEGCFIIKRLRLATFKATDDWSHYHRNNNLKIILISIAFLDCYFIILVPSCKSYQPFSLFVSFIRYFDGVFVSLPVCVCDLYRVII